MSNAISNATSAQSAPQAAVQLKAAPQLQSAQQVKAAPQHSTSSQPPPRPSDTVQISAAAKVLQETIETPAQTVKEAAGGDVQARRLLAKEAADHVSGK